MQTTGTAGGYDLSGLIAHLHGGELAQGVGAQLPVVFQIGLLGLPLGLLVLLKGAPVGAGLVAALVVRGTLVLAGKHGHSPFCGRRYPIVVLPV